jgi:hypothetical protein
MIIFILFESSILDFPIYDIIYVYIFDMGLRRSIDSSLKKRNIDKV